MKAAFFKEHGGSDKILYDDYRDPVADAGEVVVRVRACALNHVDMLLLDGRFPPPEGLPPEPHADQSSPLVIIAARRHPTRIELERMSSIAPALESAAICSLAAACMPIGIAMTSRVIGANKRPAMWAVNRPPTLLLLLLLFLPLFP